MSEQEYCIRQNKLTLLSMHVQFNVIKTEALKPHTSSFMYVLKCLDNTMVHILLMETYIKQLVCRSINTIAFKTTSLNPVPNAQVCYFNNVWFMFLFLKKTFIFLFLLFYVFYYFYYYYFV
jgi:hypothetical protein